MDSLYLALEISGPDPIQNQITQIAARLRRDDFIYVNLNQRVGEGNINDILSQFNRLRKDCEVLITHNLQHQLDFHLTVCVHASSTRRLVAD